MNTNPLKTPIFSFILPTRGRTADLTRLFESIRSTTVRPDAVEVVLVIDEDDAETLAFTYEGLVFQRIVVPPGLPMGALNMAAYEKARGSYVMIINDDVEIRTTGWDAEIMKVFAGYPDGIVLVHVNDLIFKHRLCTFPFVPKIFCEIAGGLCPTEYYRHRIDDHIYNIFNLLAVLGHKRIVYLPDVIFEHHHYVTNRWGRRIYKMNDAIVPADAEQFDALHSRRKAIALDLARHIEAFANQGRSANETQLLEDVQDAFSIRTPRYIHIRPHGHCLSSANTRVTIGVVSADAESSYARRCISAIKTTTRNYDLVLLDNNFGPDFNHSREMNKIMDLVRTDYLVLMDDDVFVEPGWLDGLLRAMTSDVGVVTPLHKDTNGRLSYAGIIFRPDNSGNHGHIIMQPEAPRPTMTLCSAILLIDMNKCRHIRFNEGYYKYFLDIDYGLQIWEAGFQVVVAPDVTVTHLAGQTLPHGSRSANQFFEKQRRRFAQRWLASGRLARLEADVFRHVPPLLTEMELAEEAQALLTPLDSETIEAYRRRAARVFEKLGPYPPLLQYLQDQIGKLAGTEFPDAGDPEKGHLFFLMGLFGHPVAIETDANGFQVLFCEKTYYAIPGDERIFDMRRVRRNGYPLLYAADSLSGLKQALARGVAGGPPPGAAGWAEKSATHLKLLGYRLHLAVNAAVFVTKKIMRPYVRDLMRPGLKSRITADLRAVYRRLGKKPPPPTAPAVAPRSRNAQRMEQVRLQYHRFRMALYAETKRFVLQKRAGQNCRNGSFTATGTLTLQPENHRAPVVMAPDYRGYTLQRDREGVRAFRRNFPRTQLTARSAAGMRRKIREKEPRLIASDDQGYRIVGYEHYFFALPGDGTAFSPAQLRQTGRRDWALAHTLPEVRMAAKRLTAATAPRPRILFFDCLLPEKRDTVLGPYLSCDLTLLTSSSTACHPTGVHVFTLPPLNHRQPIGFDPDAASPELTADLRSRSFDRVAVPSVLPDMPQFRSLLGLAASICDQVEIVYAPGEARTYAGEHLQRLLYNTAYLANLFASVPQAPGRTILELGCSDGMICDLLARLGAREVFGIDVLESVGCAYPGDGIHYRVMDGTALEFPDLFFDLAISVATLEHVPDPARILRELKRVLKVGGYGYVQAGPLYYSPFGHHMFDYFGDYPWIHLRLNRQAIVAHAERRGIDARITADLAISCEEYVEGMLNPDHLNGLCLEDYGLDDFMAAPDIAVRRFKVSCEGRELLNREILSQLGGFNRKQLIEHGFELVFQRTA